MLSPHFALRPQFAIGCLLNTETASEMSPTVSIDLGFRYSVKRLAAGIILNEQGQSVVDATYRSPGYSMNEADYWMGH